MNRRNIWIVVIPGILFVMLAFFVEAGITVNFEGWAYSEAVEKMSPELTSVIKRITHLGDSPVVILFCLLLFAIPKARKSIALPVSVTVIASSIINVLLKNIFARERPNILRLINETSYSFPSGHAMINSALYSMLILLVFKYIKRRRIKYSLSSLCILLVTAIGYSRIYLGVHYAGDVLGGWLIGFSLAVLIFLIRESLLSYREAKQKNM